MNHDSIFAPWRMEWVSKDEEDDGGCIFCSIGENQVDGDNHIVAKGSNAYVLLNKAPYNPGHSMVIPNNHVSDYASVDPETTREMTRLQQEMIGIIRETLEPDGFNIGMNIGEAGGASIADHIHIHVIPRWEGDTTFMPTIANTDVIPEALDITYHRLREEYKERFTDGRTEANVN